MSMEIAFRTERGVPPGLLLPLPEEPTDQFRTENFNHRFHDYEDIVDYGAFMVALVVWDSEVSRQNGETPNRVSMMPNSKDVEEMFEAGYGLHIRSWPVHYGGLRKLQKSLGFCPIDDEMERGALLERFQWIADYAFPTFATIEEQQDLGIADILHWASVRHLAPYKKTSIRLLATTAHL